MPKKPRPTRHRDQRRVPNELHSAAGGALLAQNARLAALAVDLEIADAAEGLPLKGRYSRVRIALMEQHGVSKSHAERAIAEGKVIFLERWRADLPEKRDRLAIQLQAIADAQQDENPQASISAIREISRLYGLYAAIKIGVTNGADTELHLDAILAVLDDEGRAALEVLQGKIDRAKAEGRLALPAPEAADPVEDVTDAEIVEPGSN